MNKKIKPKAEYELEIKGKKIKSSGTQVSQVVEEEAGLPKRTRRIGIIPKAEYSVEINE